MVDVDVVAVVVVVAVVAVLVVLTVAVGVVAVEDTTVFVAVVCDVVESVAVEEFV